jgi:hypothetical protein
MFCLRFITLEAYLEGAIEMTHAPCIKRLDFGIEDRFPMLNKTFLVLLLSAIFPNSLISASAQAAAPVIVFSEPGFPAADSASPSTSQLQNLFPENRVVTLAELEASLKESDGRLLVLPYGSAFPEEAWEEIYQFLQRGGNLLVLGGKPFTRSAYRDKDGWHLRDYSTRFTQPLMIDQYQDTPGSEGMDFLANPEIAVQLPKFTWSRGFSPVIRLSAVDLYKRGGTAGAIDARLDAFAWGVKNGR